MKKMMSMLSSGILGTLLMMGSPATADAAPYNRHNHRVHTIHKKVVHHTVVRRSVPVVKHIHHIHTPVRRIVRYVTTYSLRPHLGSWAYHRLHRIYHGNVTLFCQANLGFCIATTQAVY